MLQLHSKIIKPVGKDIALMQVTKSTNTIVLPTPTVSGLLYRKASLAVQNNHATAARATSKRNHSQISCDSTGLCAPHAASYFAPLDTQGALEPQRKTQYLPP